MANIYIDPEISAKRNLQPASATGRPRRQKEPVADTTVGWTDEKGRRMVAIAERMRAAAGLEEMRRDLTPAAMEDEMSKKSIETEELTGPKAPVGLQEAAQTTVDFEARKDKDGNLAVYELPAGDYGGAYEVAGINSGYHPEMAEKLRNMAPAERRQAAATYITEYTSPLTSKLPEPYRPFFQDLAFNRGKGGATRFLQRALGVQDDGVLGPKTLAALAGKDPSQVMRDVSVEQWTYEKALAARDPARNKFLRGLQNRIVNRFRQFGFQPSMPVTGTPFTLGTSPRTDQPVGDILEDLGGSIPS